jgi:hypothetical protein
VAGVPHRQYNEESTTERHLVVLTPAREQGKPWKRGVVFSATGVAISGPRSVFDLTEAARP